MAASTPAVSCGLAGLVPALGSGASAVAVVTRPAAQAAEWVSKLRAQGQAAEALPLLGIESAPDPAALQALAAYWHGLPAQAQAHAMFVSPNAAQCFLAAMAPGWRWPAALRALATGPGTVAALRAAGVPAELTVAPDPAAGQFDSEALWARLQHDNWQGRPVWIVRGDGGRDWFANTLRAAGAQVQAVQAYARCRPRWGPAEQAVLAQLRQAPDRARWLISSSEALDHLAALTGPWPWADSVALASHPRIVAACQAFGFGQVRPVGVGVEAALQALRAAPLGAP